MNLENLKIGRDYLEKLGRKGVNFDMKSFMVKDIKGFGCVVLPYFDECGTVGCALGWMSWAPQFFEERKWQSSYFAIGEKVFGIQEDSKEWEFLFSSFYADHDNTIEGAIGRIDTLLKYPDLFKEVS